MHEMQGDCVFVILKFLAVSVGQSCEPFNMRSHREILALDVTRIDMFAIRVAANYSALRAETD